MKNKIIMFGLALGFSATVAAESEQEKAMKEAMKQYQGMAGAAAAGNMSAIPGMSQMQNKMANQQWSMVPLGVITKAQDGKAIKMKVDFEPGSIRMPVDKTEMPESLKKFIDGENYSISGQVPVLSWKTGVQAQLLMLGPGTFEELKNIMTGNISMEDMKKYAEMQKQGAKGELTGKGKPTFIGLMPAIHDEASWKKRQEYIKKYNEVQAKHAKPTIQEVSLAERNKYIMKYAVPSPVKVGEDIFTGEEFIKIKHTYALGHLGEQRPVLQPGKTYTAFVVVLKKIPEMNAGKTRNIMDSLPENEGIKSSETDPEKVVISMDPDKQSEYWDAYYVEFTTPGA